MGGQFIASLEEVKDGEFLKREVDGKKVLLTRVNGQIAAVENRCPHLGLPLAKGRFVTAPLPALFTVAALICSVVRTWIGRTLSSGQSCLNGVIS